VPPPYISCGHGGGLRREQIFAAAALVVVAVVLRPAAAATVGEVSREGLRLTNSTSGPNLKITELLFIIL
jgi:hypothetical protein